MKKPSEKARRAPPAAGTSRADEPIWALMRKQADDLAALRHRTPNEAASDLIVLGEILQMFELCDDISGSVVAWLGDQVAKAADEVLSALMIAPAPKLPEPEGGWMSGRRAARHTALVSHRQAWRAGAAARAVGPDGNARRSHCRHHPRVRRR